VTTDNPRSEEPAVIVDDIMAGVPAGSAVERVLDRRAAIRQALTTARPGDVVVVAGKGHEREQIVGAHTEVFDDRAVARAELETLT
jgi:UDP-N-acetylmuramoyl-L-alanyl-D-glutamate--2,6-diaminopimelate ligase